MAQALFTTSQRYTQVSSVPRADIAQLDTFEGVPQPLNGVEVERIMVTQRLHPLASATFEPLADSYWGLPRARQRGRIVSSPAL